MADVFSREKRSEIMSRVKSKETSIEVKVRKFLWHAGWRYRKNFSSLPGKPDIVIPKIKTVIFVHGCFWHGHQSCGNFSLPKTRTDFWEAKINRNKQRDEENEIKLNEMGWNVITTMECQVEKSFDKTMSDLMKKLELLRNKLEE